MDTNRQLAEWIVKYNADELDGKELETFSAKLKTNPELRREMRVERDLTRALKERDVINLRKKMQKARPASDDSRLFAYLNWFIAACITALLIMLVHELYEFDRNTKMILEPIHASLRAKQLHPDREVIFPNQAEIDQATVDSMVAREARGDSSIRMAAIAMYSGLFAPLPAYERLVGDIYRGSDFKLIHPEINETFKSTEKILFKWKMNDPYPIKIILNDHNGARISITKQIEDNTYLLGPISTPGLYYYKIMDNDDMIYIGRFRIKQ
ncbi:MAG: hypothetical protein WCL00_08630 [Bacteroidota bacterium]